MQSGNKTARTPPEKAEMLADALAQKFKPLETKQVEETKKLVEEAYEETDQLPPGEIPQFTTEDVKKVLREVKLKSAVGHDGISYKTLKTLPEPALQHLVNIWPKPRVTHGRSYVFWLSKNGTCLTSNSHFI